MNDTPNKIIPNSFQTPNFFVDECMVYLTGNEIKCLIFLARKTFGWQKRSDRISKSQIMELTNLGTETVDKTMLNLVSFGLVLRIAENDVSNRGVEWALQIDSDLIRFDLMQQRLIAQQHTNREKTSKARFQQTTRGWVC